MKKRYRMFLRGNVYYAHDSETGKQVSLGTRDKRKAERLLLAINEADEQPLMNLAMARTYLAAHDPKLVTRTWIEVIEVFPSNGRESTRERCHRAFASAPFDFRLSKQRATICLVCCVLAVLRPTIICAGCTISP